jgi:hypothetical protein
MPHWVWFAARTGTVSPSDNVPQSLSQNPSAVRGGVMSGATSNAVTRWFRRPLKRALVHELKIARQFHPLLLVRLLGPLARETG